MRETPLRRGHGLLALGSHAPLAIRQRGELQAHGVGGGALLLRLLAPALLRGGARAALGRAAALQQAQLLPPATLFLPVSRPSMRIYMYSIIEGQPPLYASVSERC